MLIALGQAGIGITNGAGSLAWNLGHNEFASAEKASLYMGVHVMLTGLRGCLAPFIGSILFFYGLGAGVFWLSLALAIIAGMGFASMRNSMKG